MDLRVDHSRANRVDTDPLARDFAREAHREGAHEQPRAKLRLEPRQPPRHGRLVDAKLFARRREGALAAKDHEEAELIPVDHRHIMPGLGLQERRMRLQA